MKKTISTLLATMMLLTLLACGGALAEDYATDIDMTEEPYVVAIQVVGLPGSDYSALEADLEAAANAITVPAINAKLDIQFVWISEVVNTTSMAVAGDEKIDLVHVATVNSLSSLVGSDLLLDMNEKNLLQNRGKGLVELQGSLIKTGNVGGKQLAIPALTFNATAQGLYYNKNMTDAAGVTIPATGDLDALEEALYAFHKANPDVWPWYIGQGNLNYLYWLAGYENFGSECSYGAVLDKTAQQPKVENMYASELFKSYALRMYKWRQDGIIGSDSTNTEPAQTYLASQQLLATPATMNQTQIALQGATAAASGFSVEWLQTTGYYISNAAVTEYMWGIASNSKRPDKAMDMLNLIYTNAELANILKYGLEGKTFEFAPGTTSVTIPNGSYIIPFYYAGDQSKMYVQAPAGEDFVEKALADEQGATISILADYMFDDSEFQAESAAIYSTILQYLPTLQNGMCESEEATLMYLDEFNQNLEASGINDVIAANQAQIDAFLTAQ